jgi:hypothetical protein
VHAGGSWGTPAGTETSSAAILPDSQIATEPAWRRRPPPPLGADARIDDSVAW